MFTFRPRQYQEIMILESWILFLNKSNLDLRLAINCNEMNNCDDVTVITRKIFLLS